MADKAKNGIIYENGEPIYYQNGVPGHVGVIKIDGVIYYAGRHGKIATGTKVVHRSMSNGLLEHGTYRFDQDGKLIEGSYIAPTVRKRSKKNKKSSNRKIVIPLVIAGVLAVILVSVALIWDHTDHTNDTVPQIAESTPLVNLAEVKDEVYLCSAPLENFYKGNTTLAKAAANSDYIAYRPFELSYTMAPNTKAQLELDGKTYELNPEESKLTVDNLMTGKKYSYTLTASRGIESETYEGSFTTAATNRFIYLPGVKNTRDIGGYDTSSGKKVRQGVLIRGTEIDGLVENKYFLTDTAAAEPFRFQYDCDLREEKLYPYEYHSRLGENVRHRFYGSPMYAEIFWKESADKLKAIFTDLADQENYPMYLHCTYGADRTGTIVFLLQGLLGVSDEDKNLEYGLTEFNHRGYADGSQLSAVYSGLKSMQGDTVNEKIEHFLIDEVGVTEEQIAQIRKIYLED